jgi:DNA-binding transcriptional LysR family regulator
MRDSGQETAMQTHELRYFLAASRLLNFTKAAVECGVSQPALTRAIQKLEANLGGPLFYRRPGQIELTPLARRLLPKSEDIQRGLAEIRKEAKTEIEHGRTTLRLGVVCTVSPANIVDILRRLREQFPDVEVSIQDVNATGVLELLIADEIEIGVTAQPSIPDEVAYHPLFDELFQVAMPTDHRLAAMGAVEFAQLEDVDYLERLNCEFDHYFETTQGEWPFEFKVVFASEREDWIQALIVAGHGCAIVPQSLDCMPGVIKRPLTMPEMKRTVGLVNLRGRPLTPVGQAFIRLATAQRWTAARGHVIGNCA